MAGNIAYTEMIIYNSININNQICMFVCMYSVYMYVCVHTHIYIYICNVNLLPIPGQTLDQIRSNFLRGN